MKYTKIYNNNKLFGKFVCDGKKYTKWERRYFETKKWLVHKLYLSAKIVVVAWLVMGGIKIGEHNTQGKIVYADREVVKIEQLKFEDIPILQKICHAESSGAQFKKNGDVVRGIKNKSDIGYCQINEIIWNDKARKLGFDIYTEKGNKEMAMWLFMNYGSQPWYLSEDNWGVK
jgi:hypothetical protein